MSGPTPRQNFDRLTARAHAAQLTADVTVQSLRGSLGQREFGFALMTHATYWSVVDAVTEVLKDLATDAHRTRENDALLDALRIAVEGLEHSALFLEAMARNRKAEP